MIDGVPAATRRAAFEADDLLNQAGLIGKFDHLAGQQRQEGDVQVGLRFARDLVADASLAKWFARPFTGVAITGDGVDAYCLRAVGAWSAASAGYMVCQRVRRPGRIEPSCRASDASARRALAIAASPSAETIQVVPRRS